MKKIEINDTGLSVTELCHGTLILGPLQADLTPEEGAEAIKKSLEIGVNFFDTAQGYRTYPHLALGLKGTPRDRFVIASKSHARSYDEMKKAIDECLRDLDLEQVGIFHMHLVPDQEELEARRGALKCLKEYKEKGLIAAIGASTHTITGVRAINAEPSIDVLFPVLNYKGLGIIDGKLDGMLEALKESKQKGKFTYAMKPLGGGHLDKEVEPAFRFLRELPECDAVAVGMKSEAEVEMNVAIFEDRPLGDEIREKVQTVDRKLVIYNRCIACGLCVDECDQGALTLTDEIAEVDMDKCILCGYCAAVCPEYVIRVV